MVEIDEIDVKIDINNDTLVAQHTPKLNMLHVLMQPKAFALTKL